MRKLAGYVAKEVPPVQVFKPDARWAALGKRIVKQPGDFKACTRTYVAGTMTRVSATLNAHDIENLAH